MEAAAFGNSIDDGARLHRTLTRDYLTSLPQSADIGAAYEALVGRLIARDDAGCLRSVAGPARRRAGAYYTPPDLVDTLVRAALAPVIDDRLRNAADPAEALLGIRVVDPACGAGAFLAAALESLASRLAACRSGGLAAARRDVLRRCIFGVDSDPLAVHVCRLRLTRLAGLAEDGAPGIQCGDSLLAPPPILQCSGPAYDCVLGNPPFLNAIERAGREQRRAMLAPLTPELGGTADEAFHFLALAMRLAKDGGRIGMVLPRAILNAPAAEALRDPAHTGWYPRFLRMLDRHDHFDGPQVYVCLVALGPPGLCQTTSGLRSAKGLMSDTNWWRGAHALLNGRSTAHDTGPVVEDTFEVRAGMTAGEAYIVRPNVVDEPAGEALKLVTTGLVDPEECLWGRRRCRYLGRDYEYPRLASAPGWSGALYRRLEQARRPKVIVAGLSSRIECFLDAGGEFIGAVSTFAVFHPRDDASVLGALMESLLRPEATERYVAELGANALGGGSIRMTKSFLRRFPWG